VSWQRGAATEVGSSWCLLKGQPDSEGGVVVLALALQWTSG
jgi:hypothetical protein